MGRGEGKQDDALKIKERFSSAFVFDVGEIGGCISCKMV
jgi:hypothetical protein